MLVCLRCWLAYPTIEDRLSEAERQKADKQTDTREGEEQPDKGDRQRQADKQAHRNKHRDTQRTDTQDTRGIVLSLVFYNSRQMDTDRQRG